MATPKFAAADFVSEEQPENGYLALSLSHVGNPTRAERHASIALSGPQTSSSRIHGGRLLAKAAPEPETDRRNLRSRGVYELPLRSLFGTLAEPTSLIAKKGAPPLCWPSAWYGQVARDSGLGDAEPKHEQLAMDPRRTPEKVLTGHPCDQMADLAGDPWTPASPGYHVTDVSRARTSHYGASARRFRAGRS